MISQKLMQGSLSRTGVFIVQMGVSFFLTPFIIHSLGERLYGFWTLVGLFIGYYGLLDMGLSGAVGRFLAKAIGERKNKEINKIYNTALRLFLVIGGMVLFITVIVAIVSPCFIQNQQDNALFRNVILVLGVNTAISFPIRVYIGILHSQMEFHLVSMVEFSSMVLRTLLIVFALSLGYKLFALACISFLTSTIVNGLYIFFALNKLPSIRLKRQGFSRDTAKVLFSHSFFSFISGIADLLIYRIDALVIGFYISLSSVTHYEIASMLVFYYNQILGKIMGVLPSFYSRMQGEKNGEATQKGLYFGIKIAVTVASFIGFGFIFWGAPFIELWVGANFLDAYPCLVVLTLTMFIHQCQVPAIALLFGTSQHKSYAIMNIVEGGANLVLSLVLVRFYGIFGVALGTCIPMFISRVFVFPYLFCKITKNCYSYYMIQLATTILKTMASLIAPLLITASLLNTTYTALFSVGFASVLLYSVVIYLIMFDEREKMYLLRVIFRKNKKQS